jgi:hypothetical protein
MVSILNPAYQDKSTLSIIHNSYKNNKNFQSVNLSDFFSQEFFESKQKEIHELKYLYETIVNKYCYARAKVRKLLIINNKEFLEAISKILNRQVTIIHAYAYKFAWKNYQLIDTKEKPGIDIIIDFTEHWEESYGGTVVYKKDNGDFLEVPFIPNSVTLVRRKGKDRKYVKYVNNKCKGNKRYLIIGTINL